MPTTMWKCCKAQLKESPTKPNPKDMHGRMDMCESPEDEEEVTLPANVSILQQMNLEHPVPCASIGIEGIHGRVIFGARIVDLVPAKGRVVRELAYEMRAVLGISILIAMLQGRPAFRDCAPTVVWDRPGSACLIYNMAI